MTDTIRLALPTFILGLIIEATAGILQLASYELHDRSWIGLYYLGLATTGLGLFLMYRGRHRWEGLNRKRMLQGYRLLWSAVAMFGGAVAVIALVSLLNGQDAGSNAPPVIAWSVGGLVAFALGNFFLGLVILVDRLVGTFGKILARIGLVWSLGVAVLVGLVVSAQFGSLLDEFFTNPLGLVGSYRPLAIIIAPLFVSYLLLAAAYAEAYRLLPSGSPWLTRRRGPVVHVV